MFDTKICGCFTEQWILQYMLCGVSLEKDVLGLPLKRCLIYPQSNGAVSAEKISEVKNLNVILHSSANDIRTINHSF